MSKIKNIIAGATFTAGSLIISSNANAQETCKNILLPTKISTETSAISNKDATGIPFQRVEAGNDYWAFKYDINMKLKPTDAPVNVGVLALNKLYSKNNTTIGAEIFQVGKFNKTDVWFVDAWITQKFGNASIMFDYGKGLQIDKHSKDYIIATAKSKRISLEGCIYPQGSFFEKNIEWKKYGFISYKGDKIYSSIGNKIKTTYASAGIYGFKNFGDLVFATHNRETGDFWIKSQTAVGNVNKDFYSVNMLEIASEYLAMPAYFPLHFSPLCTKGTAALALEYKNTPSKGIAETEITLGTNKTPFIQAGLGISTEYKNHSAKSNITVELYKEVKFGKFKGSAELKYNNRKHEGTAYIKMSRTF